MTRKDYIKIADILKPYVKRFTSGQWGGVNPHAYVLDFSNMLKKDNPKFNEKRFKEYINK